MNHVIKIMTGRHQNHDVLGCFWLFHVIKIMTSLLTMGTGPRLAWPSSYTHTRSGRVL